MKITSLKDIQEIKTMVRVMDSTYDSVKESKEMIGLDLEVEYTQPDDETIAVHNKNQSHYHWFNNSDIQKLTPVEYKGRLVGEGDMVMKYGYWYEVYGYHWYDKAFRLEIALEKNYLKCTYFNVEEIEDIRPLYTPKPQEIIEVDGNRYQLIKE